MVKPTQGAIERAKEKFVTHTKTGRKVHARYGVRLPEGYGWCAGCGEAKIIVGTLTGIGRVCPKCLKRRS